MNDKNMPALERLKAALDARGLDLPLSGEPEVTLARPLAIGSRVLANRIAAQPMEGCDGTSDGRPGERTIRRYLRYARGGAALIWMEATASMEECRANPRQLWMNEDNADSFARLIGDMKEACMAENGFEPVIIMQDTHSGRYSKPHGRPEPIIAYNNPLFEKDAPIDASRIISDDGIERAEDAICAAAVLAQRAGFDGADLKSCHRYLGSELLSAYTRPGRYGGSLENRSRFLYNCFAKTHAAISGDFIITSRMNVYDGFPYPYGFGVREDGGLEPCVDEGISIIRRIHKDFGLPLIDVTIGNPYVNPHVNRPANSYPYPSPEDPYIGVKRMMDCVGAVKKGCPGVPVVGSGLSYPGKNAMYLAAGGIEQGVYDVAGFGRMMFADPDWARKLLSGKEDEIRFCLACGKCSELMRAGNITGCVMRDEYYTKLYKEVFGK